jgi:hypothetical protein
MVLAILSYDLASQNPSYSVGKCFRAIERSKGGHLHRKLPAQTTRRFTDFTFSRFSYSPDLCFASYLLLLRICDHSDSWQLKSRCRSEMQHVH